MGGDDWITWNRKVRDILVRTQVRDAKSCANGAGIRQGTYGANRAVA